MAFVDRRDPNDPDKLLGSWEELPRKPVVAPTLAELLRETRIDKRVRLLSLADATGLTVAQVSELEQGVWLPPVEARAFLLKVLAVFFGLPWSAIETAAQADGVALP